MVRFAHDRHRRVFIRVIAAGMLLLPALGARGLAQEGRQPQFTVPSTAEMEQELLRALNAERLARSLPAVQMSPELVGLARKHSAEMARRNVLSHDSETGKSYHQRLSEAEIAFVSNAENLSRSSTFLTGPIHRSLMDSPPHRATMLNGAYDAVGIGVASRNGETYFVTMDFIKSVARKSGAEIRAMTLEALNGARARARLPPIGLSDDLNAAAEARAQARARGEDASGMPAFRTRTETRYVAGPDLDKLVSLIGEQDTRGFRRAGVGSSFGRSRQYPDGAYVVCLILVWGES